MKGDGNEYEKDLGISDFYLICFEITDSCLNKTHSSDRLFNFYQ